MNPARARRIAVVIPCYGVREQIIDVLLAMGPEVSAIYVVDDACPESTADLVESRSSDPRVRVLRNEKNLGVGGATMRGYAAAMADGMDILVKVDGDGQMDPARIPTLVRPLLEGQADYAKGNRFFNLDDVSGMPIVRLIGNKVSSGYWDLVDPTNGFTALHATVCHALPLDKIARDYFFESDMLFRLATMRAVVVDVPMPAHYGGEKSHLRVGRVAATFPWRYLVRAVKRYFYGYFLRDFNAGTVLFVAGLALMAFGAIFGGIHWHQSIESGIPATSGTIMVAALPVLLGGHLLISALNYDIANVPRRPLHAQLDTTHRS
jgi:dolichol-phosphate mannosyltransferase